MTYHLNKQSDGRQRYIVDPRTWVTVYKETVMLFRWTGKDNEPVGLLAIETHRGTHRSIQKAIGKCLMKL